MSNLHATEHNNHYWSTTNTINKLHNSSTIILKSGMLYKKGEGVMNNTYKQRLFELKINGQLIYYEIKPNGDKIKKGETMLKPSFIIEKRSGGIRRDAKFIIHITANTKWYLWSNRNDTAHIHKSPSQTIYKYSPKSKTNLISSNYYSHSIFPYQNATNDHKSPQMKPDTTYTSLASISVNLTASNSHSLLSPNSKILIPHKAMNNISKRRESDDSDLWYEKSKKEANEWCDTLRNVIQSISAKEEKQTKDNCKVRSKSYPLHINNEIRDNINVEWGIKESFIMLKMHRIYKQMYFVLRFNGTLEYYNNESQSKRKGCIDLLNDCLSIEKRNGSQKRDCKFIIYTKKKKSYYFWCKNEKKLSFEWYHLIERVICDKMKDLNDYVDMAQNNKCRKSSDFSHDFAMKITDDIDLCSQ